MRDFDDHFARMSERMETARRFAGIFALLWFAVVFGILGFIGWVIVKVMQHFGVI